MWKSLFCRLSASNCVLLFSSLPSHKPQREKNSIFLFILFASHSNNLCMRFSQIYRMKVLHGAKHELLLGFSNLFRKVCSLLVEFIVKNKAYGETRNSSKQVELLCTSGWTTAVLLGFEKLFAAWLIFFFFFAGANENCWLTSPLDKKRFN